MAGLTFCACESGQDASIAGTAEMYTMQDSGRPCKKWAGLSSPSRGEGYFSGSETRDVQELAQSAACTQSRRRTVYPT